MYDFTKLRTNISLMLGGRSFNSHLIVISNYGFNWLKVKTQKVRKIERGGVANVAVWRILPRNPKLREFDAAPQFFVRELH